MSLFNFAPSRVLNNGNIRYDLAPDFYAIVPKDYKEPETSDFFKIIPEKNLEITVVNSSTVYPNEIQNVIELQGVVSIADLMIYSIEYKVDIIKIRINLEHLMGKDMNCITSSIRNDFLYMEGLHSEAVIGGINVFITPDEIVPISNKALFF